MNGLAAALAIEIADAGTVLLLRHIRFMAVAAGEINRGLRGVGHASEYALFEADI
jgi:hypothetical protein